VIEERRKELFNEIGAKKSANNSMKSPEKSKQSFHPLNCTDKEELDPIVTDEPFPQIPPSEYQAICYKANYARTFGGRQSLFLGFRIYEGRYHGTELFMACSRPERKPKINHKLYVQWSLAMGRPPKKGERLGRKAFLHKMFLVQVRDTQRKLGSTGKLLPKALQYSVVDTILEILTGIPEDE